MERGYQYGFSQMPAGRYESSDRARKAWTMLAVLTERLPCSVGEARLLNVGGSAGAIDDVLAEQFASVTSVDIDAAAIERARQSYRRDNLEFRIGDAMALEFPQASFEVVVCSHVYEHVPSAERMMAEIARVLVPGGLCYFAAGNRLMWNEPHYHLPLLSVLPRVLAHPYVRLAGKADHYHELHYTYWGLRRLIADFTLHDYTHRIIADPTRYGADYLLPAGSRKLWLARLVMRWAPWLCPGYVWVLEKPAAGQCPGAGDPG